MNENLLQEGDRSSEDDFFETMTDSSTDLGGIVYRMDNAKKRAFVRVTIQQDECHAAQLPSIQYKPVDITHLYIPYEKIKDDLDIGSKVKILKYSGVRIFNCIAHAMEFANEQHADITEYEVLTPSSDHSFDQLVAVTHIDRDPNYAVVVGGPYGSTQDGAALPFNRKPEDFRGLKLHSFLYGQLIHLPEFYILRLVENVPEIIFNHDERLRAIEKFETHGMQTTTFGRPFIRKLRKLTSEEVMTIEYQTNNLSGEITYGLAAQYIRDVALVCADLEEFISRTSIREFTCEVSNVEFDFDAKHEAVIHVPLTKDVRRCLKTQSRDTWNLGSTLVLSNTAFLGRQGLPVDIMDTDVIRNNKEYIRLEGSAASELILDALKKHKEANNLSKLKFRLGPLDVDSDIYADAIRSGFDDFFFNRFDLFKAYIGRAAPSEMKNAAKLNQDFVEQVVIEDKSLDDSQRLAMRTALAEPGFTCVGAPPGSGKTFLIASLVAAGLHYDPTSHYGICASTNVAVTNALEILHERFPDQKKVRHFSKKAEAELGKNAKILEISFKRLTRDEALITELDSDSFTDAVDKRDVAQEKLKLKAYNITQQLLLVQDYQKAETRVGVEFLNAYGAKVYGATGSLMALDFRKGITHLIIDEADQVSLVESLALLCRLPNVKQITLVGDSLQLGPFTGTDRDSMPHKLMRVGEMSRIEKFNSSAKSRLDWIYRCHPRIIDVLLNPIYKSLRSGNPTAFNLAKNLELPLAKDGSPCVFVQVDFNPRWVVANRNDEEAYLAEKLLEKLTAKGIKPVDITVICFYRAQKDYLRKIWKGKGNGNGVGYLDLPCNVSTVDSYQGKYSKFILVLTTKASEFVSDEKRGIVAVSRAQEGIYVFGDWTELFQTRFWGNFAVQIAQSGAIHTEKSLGLKPELISAAETTRVEKDDPGFSTLVKYEKDHLNSLQKQYDEIGTDLTELEKKFLDEKMLKALIKRLDKRMKIFDEVCQRHLESIDGMPIILDDTSEEQKMRNREKRKSLVNGIQTLLNLNDKYVMRLDEFVKKLSGEIIE